MSVLKALLGGDEKPKVEAPPKADALAEAQAAAKRKAGLARGFRANLVSDFAEQYGKARTGQ